MDFEFDMETIVSLGLALLEGIVVLVMMKFSGTGMGWRIIAALLSMVAGFFVTKLILSR